MQERYCTACGTVGGPRRDARGSLLAEAVLWFGAAILLVLGIGGSGFLLMLGVAAAMVGIVYSLWRLASPRLLSCRACGASNPIPADSPRAREMLRQAPTHAAAYSAQDYHHEIPAAGGGRYVLVADRQLDERTAKAAIGQAIDAGRLHPPQPGEVRRIRLH